MSIQEKIREDMVNSMKNKDSEKLNLLRVVIGEFGRIGKELSDEQSVKVIQKMHENAIEMKNDYEISILEGYIPKKLDESQIKEIVKSIIDSNNISSIKEMGKVMGELKKHPNVAQIDNKIASTVIKEMLA
jgi:uncharacterized protein YqeY